MTGPLATASETVVAPDTSWGMLLLARDLFRVRGSGNVHLVRAEAEQQPLRDGSADFVLSGNVLHHTDLETSLPALQHLLRPGGRLAAHVVTSGRQPLSLWLPVRILRSLRSALHDLAAHGLPTGLKISTLLFHPRWLHDCTAPRLTPGELAAVAAQYLPGSRVARAWRRGASRIWERPVSR